MGLVLCMCAWVWYVVGMCWRVLACVYVVFCVVCCAFCCCNYNNYLFQHMPRKKKNKEQTWRNVMSVLVHNVMLSFREPFANSIGHSGKITGQTTKISWLFSRILSSWVRTSSHKHTCQHVGPEWQQLWNLGQLLPLDYRHSSHYMYLLATIIISTLPNNNKKREGETKEREKEGLKNVDGTEKEKKIGKREGGRRERRK